MHAWRISQINRKKWKIKREKNYLTFLAVFSSQSARVNIHCQSTWFAKLHIKKHFSIYRVIDNKLKSVNKLNISVLNVYTYNYVKVNSCISGPLYISHKCALTAPGVFVHICNQVSDSPNLTLLYTINGYDLLRNKAIPRKITQYHLPGVDQKIIKDAINTQKLNTIVFISECVKNKEQCPKKKKKKKK